MEERLTKMDFIWAEGAMIEKNISKKIPKFLDEMMVFLLREELWRKTRFGGERL